jgi:hypothetical protein
VFSLVTLPPLYSALKHEGFFWKPPQSSIKQVTLVYQNIIDEIPVSFEAHWLNLLTAPMCACWCHSHANEQDIPICRFFAVNPVFPLPHILYGYQFQCKVAMDVFYLVYLTPYMILEGKHERLGIPSWIPIKSIDKQPDWSVFWYKMVLSSDSPTYHRAELSWCCIKNIQKLIK